tara:strand:+ start:2332 stop:3822 length:1491 start_codon:yes stop_codon:yes gene_type:complete
MAVYKLFPSQDASIYSAYPAMNTGLDPILDIANYVTESNPVARVARSIIAFDQSEIENVIDNIAIVTGSGFNSWSGSLKAYVAKASNVILNSYVEAWPISGSWNNGTGQYLDNKQGTNGVSWKYSDYSGSYEWPTAGFVPLTTGSFSGSNNAGGGVWYTGSDNYSNVNNANMGVSQSFNLRSEKDLDLNVTDVLKVWYSSSKDLNSGLIDVDNNGFLLKWQNSREFVTSSAVSPQLSYYSVDTNTIYPPTLEIKWRDFTYSTSSGDFKLGRILTGSYPSVTTAISCSSTASLPTPASNTGVGSGAIFKAEFKSPNTMSRVFIDGNNVGSGYKAGDVLTFTAAQLNSIDNLSGATGDATVTLSTFDIQQLDVIGTPDLFVALDDNPGVFYSESINRFRVNCRPEFPARTFKTSSLYTTNHALPSSSYYAIKDLDTNEFVVDFDTEFTQISCDATSSYFTVYMNGLEPERYYNILIQTEIQGQTIVMDENYYFKVVNG